MELWIRSQDKEKLVKVNELSLLDNNILRKSFILSNASVLIDDPDYFNISIIANDKYNLGTYKSKERVLEVLDEIQQLIKNQYVVECNPMLDKASLRSLKEHFKDNYSGEFILQPPSTKIHSINSNVVVYEMPKE